MQVPTSLRGQVQSRKASKYGPPFLRISLHLALFVLQAWDSERRRLGAAANSSGDAAYQLRQWCREHFISDTVMETVRGLREQFLDHLQHAGFCDRTASGKAMASHSAYASDARLLQCVLCAGLYPQVSWFVRPKSSNLGEQGHVSVSSFEAAEVK